MALLPAALTTGSTTALTAASIACALCLAACLDAGDKVPDPVEWAGMIGDACGPAGGRAVSVRLDGKEYADCGESHPSEYSMLLEGLDLGSVKVNRSYADTQETCERSVCSETITKITVNTISLDGMQGTYDIRTQVAGSPEARKSGPLTLKKCPNAVGCL
jgi:hypothetical protein